jgi:hypothetical protein
MQFSGQKKFLINLGIESILCKNIPIFNLTSIYESINKISRFEVMNFSMDDFQQKNVFKKNPSNSQE